MLGQMLSGCHRRRRGRRRRWMESESPLDANRTGSGDLAAERDVIRASDEQVGASESDDHNEMCSIAAYRFSRCSGEELRERFARDARGEAEDRKLMRRYRRRRARRRTALESSGIELKIMDEEEFSIPSSPLSNMSRIIASCRRTSCYCCFATLALIALVALVIGGCDGSQLADFDGATFYKAPVGSRVRIACNGSHWSDDSVSLVLWFKGTIERHSVPIYTVDARQKPLNDGARHFVADRYKGRAKFITKATPPYLDLAPLEADDQSEYRCRIDYRSKPRENFLIILFVLVPPKSVQIMDSSGRSLEQIYGPLSEDSDLTLLCLSKGGRPAPSVTWKRRKKVIDDSYLTLNDFLALKQSASLFPQFRQRAGGEQFAPETATATLNNASGLNAPPADSFNAARTRKLPAPRDEYDDGLQSSRGGGGESGADSINAPTTYPSLAQLESLWLEWRAWPEFKFFGRQLAKLDTQVVAADELLGTVAGNQLALADQQQPLADSGQTGGSAGFNQQRKVNGSSSFATGPLLLTLDVHESVVTAVNVLSAPLAGLSRIAAAAPELAPARSSGQQQQQQPVLECEASNLHYDLRTLIKLFAPPSLSGGKSGASGKPAAKPQVASSESTHQLVQAIERALELSASADWSSYSNSSHKSAARAGPEATALRHSNSSGSDDDDVRGLDSVRAATLYQQLSRPHQLLAASQERMAAEGDSDIAAQNMAPEKEQPAAGSDEDSARVGGHDSSAGKSSASTSTSPLQSSAPLVRSKLIALDIYTRPADVRIVTPQSRPLSAGQLAEFQCESSGSRPRARLSWLKNGHLLEPRLQRQVDEPSGNASYSKLSIRLEQQDHGAQLTCRAENELLGAAPGGQLVVLAAGAGTSGVAKAHGADTNMARPAMLEDSRILSVQYAPKLKLELGSMLSRSVREGSDVYFVCQADAQPAVREISWLHNERPLNESSVQRGHEVAGVIISNNSLVLQKVKVEQRGRYACMASNSEGLGESNRIELRVLHAPRCAPAGGDASAPADGVRRVVPMRTRVRLVCQLDADPPELELSWYLNNSVTERRLISVQSAASGRTDHRQSEHPETGAASTPELEQRGMVAGRQVQPHKTSLASAAGGTTISQLDYLVDTTLDYGQLHCVGRNSIGEQRHACVYEIAQPDPNEAPPLSCSAVNVSSSSAWIACDRPQFATNQQQPHDESSPAQLWPSFSVEVYSLPPAQQHQEPESPDTRGGDLQRWQRADARFARLEAQLDSGPLPDPLLSISHLRPATRHAVQVRAQLGEQLSQQALVRFSTLESAGDLAASANADQQKNEPTIDSADQSRQQQQPALISALISTRSATGQQLAAELAEHSMQLQQQATPQNGSGSVAGLWLQRRRLAEQGRVSARQQQSIWSWLWESSGLASMGQLFLHSSSSTRQSVAKTRDGHQAPEGNQRLIGLPVSAETLPLASIGLLVLLASLAAGATLLLQRRRLAARRRQVAKQQQQSKRPSFQRASRDNFGEDDDDDDDDCCLGAGGGSIDLASTKLSGLASADHDNLKASGGHSSSSASSPMQQQQRQQPLLSSQVANESRQLAATRAASSVTLANQSIGLATMGHWQHHNQAAPATCDSSYATLELGARPARVRRRSGGGGGDRLQLRASQQQLQMHEQLAYGSQAPTTTTTTTSAAATAASSAVKPICVSKSRSSLCLESLRLLAPSEPRQQFASDSHHFIYQNSDGTLISDANFQLPVQQTQRASEAPWRSAAICRGQQDLSDEFANLERANACMMMASEESSDSNMSHCTWSHNNLPPASSIHGDVQSEQLQQHPRLDDHGEMHFIELVPSSSAECLDTNLVGKLLIECQPPNTNNNNNNHLYCDTQLQEAQNFNDHLGSQQHSAHLRSTLPQKCNLSSSLASSSIGSSSQAACCSPRSLTNSNTESLLINELTPTIQQQQQQQTASLYAGGECNTTRRRAHYSNQDNQQLHQSNLSFQLPSTPTETVNHRCNITAAPITSILKNSRTNKQQTTQNNNKFGDETIRENLACQCDEFM